MGDSAERQAIKKPMLNGRRTANQSGTSCSLNACDKTEHSGTEHGEAMQNDRTKQQCRAIQHTKRTHNTAQQQAQAIQQAQEAQEQAERQATTPSKKQK